MKFVIKVRSSYDMETIDACFVELDADDLKVIAARRKLFQMAHADDTSLYSLRYWGGVDFFENTSESLDEELEEKEVLTPPACFELKDDAVARTECCTMVVTDRGIHWTAYPKHCDSELRSECLTWDDLFSETSNH